MQKMQDKAAEIKAKAETARTKLNKRREEQCNKVSTNVKRALDRFGSRHPVHIEKYQDIKKRITSLIGEFKAANLDTLELEQALNNWAAEINALNELIEESYTYLGKSTEMACGQAEGAYISELQKSRQVLARANVKVKEIHNNYRGKLRPLVKKLLEQLPPQKSNI
jgi:hypothetical protein